MGKILVIVESPGKIKKIQSILGKGYTVVASVGHIIDLDPSNISVDIANNFEPIYKVISRQAKVVKNLKQLVKKSSDVLLATDDDREGEMIAWSLAHVLKLKNPKRIIFNSITKADIQRALTNPGLIDQKQVNAQKARRILDRIVGYEVSPLLWKNVQKKLSAGRVQSVVVRLIVDREMKVKSFYDKDESSHYKFKGIFENNKLITQLYKISSISKKQNIFKGSIAKLENEKKSIHFLKKCIKSKFTLKNMFNKKSIKNSSAPYTTSTLQQDASRKLGYNVKRTMRIAQNLYEAGHITYMRTDSYHLSLDALTQIKQHIITSYGEKYYKETKYSPKSKHTQEAHEAVRPTKLNKLQLTQTGRIAEPEQKLYSLIWKRTVASQMPAAEYTNTTIQISISKSDKYYFTTTVEHLVFEGFLKVYGITVDQKTLDEGRNTTIPNIGSTLSVTSIAGLQEYAKPPPRYSEASLINELDPKNLNIGRPATYASIISKIQERKYVRQGDIEGQTKQAQILHWDGKTKTINEDTKPVIIGHETNKFIPTTLGIIVNDYLVTGFPKILDYKFTANMENNLDKISEDKLVWHEVLDKFYKQFHPQIIKLMNEKSIIGEKYTTVLGQDPLTGSDIVATMAQYGPVVKLCLTKTKCKYGPIKLPITLETITLEQAIKILEYPKDVGKYKRKMVTINRGKYGYFIKHGKKEKYAIPPTELDLTAGPDNGIITLDQAITIIENKQKKDLKKFTDDTKLYTVLNGPYGLYVKLYDKKTKKKYNIGLPKDTSVETLTLDILKKLIDDHFKKPRKKFFKKYKKKN